MRSLTLAAACCLALAPAAQAQDSVLTVYTYDSFVSDFGPGPKIKEAFEAQCDCALRFVAAGDGAELLARIRLEGARTDADVVLGLDSNLTAAAAETGLFAPHGLDATDFDMPVEWEDALFLPYDWGYFAFVYDSTRLSDPPGDFRELAESDTSIVIQDPRSSTPGLGLLLWVKAAYGDEAAEIWGGLADNIVTVTQGWSEAYGLFLDGEAEMALSYTTSPAYHAIAEDDDTKAAARFAEGHYLQIEVAGKIAGADEEALAEDFLRFMVEESFQSVIPTTNWMYPAVTPEDGLPSAFDELIAPEQALMYPAGEADEARDEALDEWRRALSR